MEHVMQLDPIPMKEIREGRKTIELRLYDEKRKLISVGDTIKFVSTDNPDDTLLVRAKELFVFDSFEELYNNLPLTECGYTEENVSDADPADMEVYYSKERQSRYGVVGIKLSLL